MNTIGLISNSIHIFFFFFPFLIFAIPKLLIYKSFKYIMLLYLLTPLHWIFFNNSCILTIFTRDYGNNIQTTENETESQFSEKYLKWLYKPIMEMIGWKWTDEIDKMVYLHWIVIFICLWYYAFFINQKII